MPILDGISCQVLLPGDIPFKEYCTRIKTGILAKTYIAVPECSVPFSIRLQSDRDLDLAAFVYIDGVLQVHRHHGLFDTNSMNLHFTGSENCVKRLSDRQQEVVRRNWRFDKFIVVDEELQPSLDEHVLKSLGNIEVVLLRCRENMDLNHVPRFLNTFKSGQERQSNDQNDELDIAGLVKAARRGKVQDRFRYGYYDGANDYTDSGESTDSSDYAHRRRRKHNKKKTVKVHFNPPAAHGGAPPTSPTIPGAFPASSSLGQPPRSYPTPSLSTMPPSTHYHPFAMFDNQAHPLPYGFPPPPPPSSGIPHFIPMNNGNSVPKKERRHDPRRYSISSSDSLSVQKKKKSSKRTGKHNFHDQFDSAMHKLEKYSANKSHQNKDKDVDNQLESVIDRLEKTLNKHSGNLSKNPNKLLDMLKSHLEDNAQKDQKHKEKRDKKKAEKLEKLSSKLSQLLAKSFKDDSSTSGSEDGDTKTNTGGGWADTTTTAHDAGWNNDNNNTSTGGGWHHEKKNSIDDKPAENQESTTDAWESTNKNDTTTTDNNWTNDTTANNTTTDNNTWGNTDANNNTTTADASWETAGATDTAAPVTTEWGNSGNDNNGTAANAWESGGNEKNNATDNVWANGGNGDNATGGNDWETGGAANNNNTTNSSWETSGNDNQKNTTDDWATGGATNEPNAPVDNWASGGADNDNTASGNNWGTGGTNNDIKAGGNWAPTASDDEASKAWEAHSHIGNNNGNNKHNDSDSDEKLFRNHWRSIPRMSNSSPHLPQQPLYTIPKDKVPKNVTHQVRGGPAEIINVPVSNPKYLDSFERPYLVFRFKYRDPTILREQYGFKVKELTKEAEKQVLASLSKDDLVEMLLKKPNNNKDAKEGNTGTGNDMAPW